VNMGFEGQRCGHSVAGEMTTVQQERTKRE
jgi:hypothetical protein